jgi:uncharacterized protein
MPTVDIHTHLLAPGVRFDRPFDRLAILFFGRALGVDPKALRADPFRVYLETFARLVGESQQVGQACLFGVDACYDEQGRETHRDPTVCGDNEAVWAAAQRFPDRFIPFFSVNPLRRDALERIDEYAERGFRGAKFLQNYWGVDLRQERFLPYYEGLARHRLPLVIHLGSEFTVPSNPELERVEMVDLPLAAGVKVIAAHMGIGMLPERRRPWRNLSRDPRHFWAGYYGLLERLEEQPNLYADLAAILTPNRARVLRHLSQQTAVHPKLLFGTDYPVPFTTVWNSHDLPCSRRRAIAAIRNPFDRYAALLLEYFPPGHPLYENHRKVLAPAG